MKKKILIASVYVATALLANAQGLHNLMGSAKPMGKTTAPAANSDESSALSRGNDLVSYVTAATDQGVKAAQELIAMYPPEKVQAIKERAAKYNEIRAKNPNQNLDVESIQVASQVASEASKLDSDWQGYHKEKTQAVRNANMRLALLLLADGQAGEKTPETISALQKSAQALASNPMQAAKAQRLLNTAALLTVICKEMPEQIRSFTTVRAVIKKVADAENMTLANNPSPAAVRDLTSLNTSTRELKDGE